GDGGLAEPDDEAGHRGGEGERDAETREAQLRKPAYRASPIADGDGEDKKKRGKDRAPEERRPIVARRRSHQQPGAAPRHRRAGEGQRARRVLRPVACALGAERMRGRRVWDHRRRLRRIQLNRQNLYEVIAWLINRGGSAGTSHSRANVGGCMRQTQLLLCLILSALALSACSNTTSDMHYTPPANVARPSAPAVCSGVYRGATAWSVFTLFGTSRAIRWSSSQP